MNSGEIIRLILQVLVFIAWAAMMFAVLFKFRRRNEDSTGGAFPSTGGFMAQVKHWWQSPEDRQERNTLVWLTLVLIGMMATNMLL